MNCEPAGREYPGMNQQQIDIDMSHRGIHMQMQTWCGNSLQVLDINNQQMTKIEHSMWLYTDYGAAGRFSAHVQDTGLGIIKLSTPNFLRTVENCIREGAETPEVAWVPGSFHNSTMNLSQCIYLFIYIYIYPSISTCISIIVIIIIYICIYI